MTTSTADAQRSLGEAYISATGTGRLEVDADRRTDADVLLAAAFASAGNLRGSMALVLYRLSEDWRETVVAQRRQALAPDVARLVAAALAHAPA